MRGDLDTLFSARCDDPAWRRLPEVDVGATTSLQDLDSEFSESIHRKFDGDIGAAGV